MEEDLVFDRNRGPWMQRRLVMPKNRGAAHRRDDRDHHIPSWSVRHKPMRLLTVVVDPPVRQPSEVAADLVEVLCWAGLHLTPVSCVHHHVASLLRALKVRPCAFYVGKRPQEVAKDVLRIAQLDRQEKEVCFLRVCSQRPTPQQPLQEVEEGWPIHAVLVPPRGEARGQIVHIYPGSLCPCGVASALQDLGTALVIQRKRAIDSVMAWVAFAESIFTSPTVVAAVEAIRVTFFTLGDIAELHSGAAGPEFLLTHCLLTILPLSLPWTITPAELLVACAV
mmetsp:Transcript_2040/g.5176  ORF Transcript_2040/g.5176 Transcript_2040/m.5176 type:complete len:280 (-) Transcript_2040:291-1130(-)